MTKNELMTLLAAGACAIYFITHMLLAVNAKPIVKPIPKNIELDTIQIEPILPVDHTVFVAS